MTSLFWFGRIWHLNKITILTLPEKITYFQALFFLVHIRLHLLEQMQTNIKFINTR